MPATRLRMRQVHLDFHTSQHIPAVAAQFDPEHFALCLEAAYVNSVTCFARCHHGYLYYESQRFPERVHPHLQRRDLLREQIEACHARGIRVPIYVTVQWDAFTAHEHPDWLALDADGKVQGTQPYEAGFYNWLCVHSPYHDFLKAHVQEILETLPVDGLFFDIVQPLDDSSRWTRDGMLEQGLNPADEQSRKAYGLRVINQFELDMTAFVHKFNPEASVFYNSGHIGPRHRQAREAFTHFEVESLPSGHWGYVHFPLAARYARRLGLPILGMTGKFHTFWGDFHSYKNQAALEYECFRMLALGAGCSIGDQLLPSGELDQPTYDLIGAVYKQVEAKEAWCIDVEPACEIGVFSPELVTEEQIPASGAGAQHMLEELGHQFDFIDAQTTFADYRLLILPDEAFINEDIARKLRDYLAQGGAVIASCEALLNRERAEVALPGIGLRWLGDMEFEPTFIVPDGEIGHDLPKAPHVMYQSGLKVECDDDDVQVLAQCLRPYFNRSWEHFTSHRHASSDGSVYAVAITRKDRFIYFAHPIFTQYYDNRPKWVKTLVRNAISILISDPLIVHDGPSTLMVTLNRQIGQERLVLHALHYIPIRRSATIDVIEDVIPLHDVTFNVHVDRQVRQVMSVPDRVRIDFEQKDNRLYFVLPCIDGHGMVVIEQ